eukprot:2324028-Pyramimonas_sp.AAC.1
MQRPTERDVASCSSSEDEREDAVSGAPEYAVSGATEEVSLTTRLSQRKRRRLPDERKAELRSVAR